MEVKQELLHADLKDGVQRVECDLGVRLIDQSDSTEDLRKFILATCTWHFSGKWSKWVRDGSFLTIVVYILHQLLY